MNDHRCFHAPRYALSASALLLALGSGPARAQTSAAQRAAAQGLFDEASKLMDRRKYAEACPKLEEVVRLQPGKVGAVFTLAECYEGAGKLASAWASLLECEALARKLRDPRQKRAHDWAARLEPRLTRLQITVAQGAPADLVVRRDGMAVGRAQWEQALPIDPGSYRIEASAAGKKPWSAMVEVAGEAKLVPVEIPDLPAEPSSPATPDAPHESAAPPSTPDRAEPPAAPNKGFGHAWQPGVFARADVDGKFRGLVTVLGLSFGLGDHVEVAAGAAIGRDKGFWAGATGFVLTGHFKPMLLAGTHVLFADAPRAGLHAAGGLEWDPIRHFGVYLLAGLSYFPSLPASYDQLVFLPSLGVQGRL